MCKFYIFRTHNVLQLLDRFVWILFLEEKCHANRNQHWQKKDYARHIHISWRESSVFFVDCLRFKSKKSSFSQLQWKYVQSRTSLLNRFAVQICALKALSMWFQNNFFTNANSWYMLYILFEDFSSTMCMDWREM